MIEITHKQAQHLIREGLDRPLPDAQWAVLQTHLERCPECTAYRERLSASQRGLTHALRLRWSSARGPRPGAAQYLVDLHERRVKQRKWLVQASRYGLVLLLLAAFLAYRSLTAPEPPQPPRPAAPTQAAGEPGALIPTPSLIFRGLVAFEEQRGGDSEIVLLNVSGGQVDRSNLTNSPGSAETHPAWSPDGEWIAFLSDRSGKNEIYLMTVAGSRLTQITSTPAVDWQGPLDWSADGSLIALTGMRADAAGDPFLYLVPTDGGAPRPVAFTRGAQPWARFSPSEPLLAYPAPDGGIQVLNTQTGRTANAAPAQMSADALLPAHLEAFDWALGGRNLLYTAVPSPLSSYGEDYLRMSAEMNPASLPILNGSPEQIAEVDRPGAFRAVTAVPSSLLVASLESGEQEGCWNIRLDHAYNRMVAPRRLSDLCVEGGLESDSWTADGNWLVLLARRPSESAPSIYAVRLPQDDSGAPLYERLGDITLLPGSGTLGADLPPGPALRVRRIGRRLALDPQPAEVNAVEQAPTVLPPAPPEDDWIYYTERQGQNSQIFRAHPDGTQPEPLTGANADLQCPRAGPDGRVAYLSNMGRTAAGTSEIFVMDGAGDNHNLLTRAGNRRYQCPVWSPDGSRIAAFNSMEGEPSLAVMPSDGSAEPIFLPVDLVGMSEPVWLPNDPLDTTQGYDRLLAAVPQGRNPVRLLEFDLRKPEGEREKPVELAMFTGWDDIWGLTLSPDSRHLAMALVFFNRSENVTGPSAAQLRVVDLATLDTQVRLYLSNFNVETAGLGSLAWLSEERVGVLRSTSLIAPQKSVFEVVDLSAPAGLVRVARFPDIIYTAAWSSPVMQAQGEALAGANPARVEGMIFASESGLWAVDLRLLAGGSPFIEGGLLPAQIAPGWIESVSWR